MKVWDAVILGAGAAGLFCASRLAQRGLQVCVLEPNTAPGKKIRISGGGRCNFTNIHTTYRCFASSNPDYARSALARYTPQDFIALVESYGIAWHEKTLGQLFCDGSAQQIIDMLVRDLMQAGGELWLGTTLGAVRPGFEVETARGPVRAESVIVATGGKSIPKMGATGYGYDVAQAFGLPVIPPRPALVPLTFTDARREGMAALAGLSVPARVGVQGARIAFDEGLLFTHRGLSGPSILQISSYWREGQALVIDLAPGRDIVAELTAARGDRGGREVANALDLPERLARLAVTEAGVSGKLAGLGKAGLTRLSDGVHRWQVVPAGSEGWRTAEVTLGGVDTDALDARTMAARAVPGLFFVGEVVDVTGWLGGYNFQWAWSSGWAAGQVA